MLLVKEACISMFYSIFNFSTENGESMIVNFPKFCGNKSVCSLDRRVMPFLAPLMAFLCLETITFVAQQKD